MDHLPTGNEPADDLLYTFGVLAIDGDGSEATGSFNVRISDDGPMAFDTDGIINNTAGESLRNLVYDVNEDGLGSVALSLDSVTSGGSAHTLTSYGKAISIHTEMTEDGLAVLYGKANIDDDAELETIFSLAPEQGSGDAGSYMLTMHDMIDLPPTWNTFSVKGVDAHGPQGEQLIEDLSGGDLVMLATPLQGADAANANDGEFGLDNTLLDSAHGTSPNEIVQLDFGTSYETIVDSKGDVVDWTITKVEVVNDLKLDIFDTGQSNDSFNWVAYRDGQEVGRDSIAGHSNDQFSAIHVDGGYDSLTLEVTLGSFKVAGFTYTLPDDPQDVLMSFGYTAQDADGDFVAGTFDVVVSAVDETSLSDTTDSLLHNDYDPNLEDIAS
jgi:hypothetical protein